MYLDSAIITQIQSLHTPQNQSMDNQSNSMTNRENQTLIVSLKSNPIKCCCKSLPFLNWLLQMNDTFTCSLAGSKSEVTEYSIRLAEYECKQSYVIAIFSVFSVCELIAITLMILFVIKEVRNRRKRKKTEKWNSII